MSAISTQPKDGTSFEETQYDEAVYGNRHMKQLWLNFSCPDPLSGKQLAYILDGFVMINPVHIRSKEIQSSIFNR